MESEKEPLSFGRYLQAIRLEKKISLEQVSAQTRIGLGNLLLIEQEDHERLPAKVYVKGFLRSYAAAVGADGDEAVRRYESRLDVAKKISDSEYSSKRVAPKIWWKLLIALVLLICIIGFSVYAIIFLRNQAERDSSAVPKPFSGKEAVVDKQTGGQDPEADSEPEKAVPQKLMLQVTALEETWLKVIIDEKAPTEYNLKSGDQIELEAVKGYNLLIGNARGVIITLNDEPVLISGKSGEVVTIHLP